MGTHVDANGKLLTEVVGQDRMRVIVQALSHRIRGDIFLRPGERLKDWLNEGESFFAVKAAEALDPDGRAVLRADFMAVHRSHVVWITSDAPAAESGEPAGG